MASARCWSTGSGGVIAERLDDDFPRRRGRCRRQGVGRSKVTGATLRAGFESRETPDAPAMTTTARGDHGSAIVSSSRVSASGGSRFRFSGESRRFLRFRGRARRGLRRLPLGRDREELHARARAGIANRTRVAALFRNASVMKSFCGSTCSRISNALSTAGPDGAPSSSRPRRRAEAGAPDRLSLLLLGRKIELAFAPRLERALERRQLADEARAEWVDDLAIEEVDRLAEDLLHPRRRFRCRGGIDGVHLVVFGDVGDEKNRLPRLHRVPRVRDGIERGARDLVRHSTTSPSTLTMSSMIAFASLWRDTDP